VPRSHPRYAPEFRAEAIRLVREGGRTPKQLAADLGCSEASISGWLKQADLDAGQRHDGLTTAEHEELRQLRSENRILRMERDLLKKAAAFFAKESDPIR
jgi:transposase